MLSLNCDCKKSRVGHTVKSVCLESTILHLDNDRVYMMDVARLSITNNDIWRCKQQPKTNIVCLEESFVNILSTRLHFGGYSSRGSEIDETT